MVENSNIEEDNNGSFLEKGNKSNCGYKSYIWGYNQR